MVRRGSGFDRLELVALIGGSLPKFLLDKLKKRYGKKSKIPYKILNSIGAMRGNKETARGRAMENKHMGKLSDMA